MKTSHHWVISLLLTIPIYGSAQQSGIESALQKGNAAELGTFFCKSIDLSMPGVEEAYPADKAVTILADFFSRQTVKGYKRSHEGAPQEGRANYSIGDLYTSQGIYRITLYYDTQQKITEIRIQK